MPPVLIRLEYADVSGLTAIKAAAFGPDALQNLMFPPAQTAKSYGPWAESLYQESLQLDPTCHLVKCSESTTGEMMSIAQWQFYEKPGSFDTKTFPQPTELNPPKGSNPDLWFKFLTAMNESRKRHMSGKPFYLLKLLVTHPKHQGKGAGTALVKYGTTAADRAGLQCYLEASPDGYKLYSRYGFKKVDEITIDLSPYGVNDSWKGVVMIREPGAG